MHVSAWKHGAGERARTVDLYLGKVPLYQLSYTRGEAEDFTTCQQAGAMTQSWVAESPRNRGQAAFR